MPPQTAKKRHFPFISHVFKPPGDKFKYKWPLNVREKGVEGCYGTQKHKKRRKVRSVPYLLTKHSQGLTHRVVKMHKSSGVFLGSVFYSNPNPNPHGIGIRMGWTARGYSGYSGIFRIFRNCRIPEYSGYSPG